MRIQWNRVVLYAMVVGLLILLARGYYIARCSGGEQPVAAENQVAITVFDHRKNQAAEQSLETYLVGVVAAEMPATFPEEALKAQAVAARTYTVYHMLHGGCRQHGTDVCTDSSCCQAYCDFERRKEKWLGQSGAYEKKVAAAVAATAGEVLLFEGQPIDALYHSASGGQTENAEDVYSTELPYLKSVMSTAEAGTEKIDGQITMSASEFCNLVNQQWPQAKLKENGLAEQVQVIEQTESGRVGKIRLGNTEVTGRNLRSLLKLDSTLFTIQCSGDSVLISSKGYGHGVGMSQTGANVMALGGRTYAEILLYYYTGAEIGRLELTK